MAMTACEEVIPEDLMPSVITSTSPIVYYKTASVGGVVVNQAYAKSVGIYYGEEKGNLSGYVQAKVSEDGDFTAELNALKPGTRYYYQAVAKLRKEDVTGEVCEFITFPEGPVDLGLPSGLKWSSTNLGAEYPTEYGCYYAWGEVKEKQQFDWTSYLMCKGTLFSITKYYDEYKKTDNRTILEPEDDAAHVNLGGAWRMPTAGDWAEVIEYCTQTPAKINGVNGLKIYNKKINDPTNFIFLPFAGYRDGVRFHSQEYDAYYWTSSLYLDYHIYAYAMEFNNYGFSSSYASRDKGLTIRPVCR